MVKTKTKSKREEKVFERIKIIINEHCEGKQSIFSKRTGLSKGTVSNYVNEKNVPSEKCMDVISTEFGVSKAWLFGFYDPNESGDLTIQELDNYHTSSEEAIHYKHLYFIALAFGNKSFASECKANFVKEIRKESSKIRYGFIKRDCHCQICKCSEFDKLEMHHIVPVSDFGDNDPSNLITLCRDCHDWIHKMYRNPLPGIGSYDAVDAWVNSLDEHSMNAFSSFISRQLTLKNSRYCKENLLNETIKSLYNIWCLERGVEPIG